MKKIMIGVASLMMVSLIISLLFYQNSDRMIPPEHEIAEQSEIAQGDQGQPKSEELQPIFVNENAGYSLQNDQLNITFDNGKKWTTVPVEKDSLFSGEYNGNKHELIEHSYFFTKNTAFFLYTKGSSVYGKRIYLRYSNDRGMTWEDTVVTEDYPPIRFRKVAFLNDRFGYAILSGDRTMSQEMSSVFLTYDGGENWSETNSSGVTRLIADGGFVDDKTGFLSYGTINPEKPQLYFTNDGGNTWKEAIIHIPEKYQLIFVIAETPINEGDHLALLINQGPNGDYEGGEVRGKFLSVDSGETWEFTLEVKPNDENESSNEAI